MRHRRLAAAVTLIAAAAVSASLLASLPTSVSAGPSIKNGERLDTPETMTTQSEELAQGVELISLAWGEAGADDRWRVLVRQPEDPDGPIESGTMTLGPEPTAERVAGALKEAGYEPTVAPVESPEFADSDAFTIGWTVHIGSFATEAEARAMVTELRAAGFVGATRYTAQDGNDPDAPQAAYVLRIDFEEYNGEVVAAFGETVNDREHLTEAIASTGAIAGINSQWFYRSIGPASGGLYVKDGKIQGTVTQGRGGILLREGGRVADVDAYTGHHWLTAGDETVPVDAVNRLPGQVQNCGGIGGDLPTEAPQHDLLCTDDSELVKFTPEWGTEPTGAGAEAVLNGRGRVLAVNQERGADVPPGGSTIQAIGDAAEWLLEHVKVGEVVNWREEIRDSAGHRVRLTSDTTILQVGPTLIDDGEIEINARADGLFHEGPDQSFTYHWVLRSNPRTAIAMDDDGRLLLSVVDGRQPTYSEGLSIVDHARFLKHLGAVEALNLDGGGSSVLATSDGIVNRPSDATGPRELGNPLLVMPPE